MHALTPRQQQVLAFVTKTQARTGFAPSTREIQEHFGFSSQTAALHHLRALERKGIIRRQAGKARAVAVVTHQERAPIVDVPVCGTIAAGYAETIEHERIGSIALDASLTGVRDGRRTFALKVRGDSMTGAGIHDGDTAILENREPRKGDIVAALIDGETTLKRYVMERGRACLKAENLRFPKLIPVRELVVQGVLVALVRKYS